ncbi:MAG: hypothetical protein QM662_00350 [Gordonia sp. (in: high G+C Gram-positive bacteria)]
MRSPDLFHSLTLLHLLFTLGLWTLLRPSVPAAIGLSIVAFAWTLWNGPLEGEVLIRVTPAHGLTESDLLAGIAIGIALWAYATARRRRHVASRD